MISGKLIKNRIKSVKNTKKVTKSMELIAAVKLQKTAERSQSVSQFRARLAQLQESIVVPEDFSHPLLSSSESPRQVVIVFSSDRGLCGSFNAKVRKRVQDLLADVPAEQVECIAYGKVAAKGLKADGYTVTQLYPIPETNVTVESIKPTVVELLQRYEAGEIGRITLVYTHFHSMMQQEVVVHTLAPVSFVQTVEPTDTTEQLPAIADVLEPGPSEVLEYVLRERIQVEWYSALINSMASEHVARMVAMKTASDASADLIDSLTLAFNKARQASITQEITEIVSGMESITQAVAPTAPRLSSFKLFLPQIYHV